MKEELDIMVGALRQYKAPECPDALEANVLRRIRVEKNSPSEESILGWISGLVPNTGFALSAIALVVAVTAMATAVSTLSMASDRKAELNQALGFDSITLTEFVNLERR